MGETRLYNPRLAHCRGIIMPVSTPTQANPSATASTDSGRIARSAGLVMIAFVISQVVGLAAKSIIGSAFGTSMESEAYLAANRIPEILFNLVAGGALGSAFIPVLSGMLENKDNEAAWKLTSAVINLVLLILAALCLVAAVFAPQIVRYLLAPGFSSAGPEKEALTVLLLRIQLPSAAIFALSGIVMGVLNAHQRFLLPALTPSMYSFGLIFGALVLAPRMGAAGLGWGVVIGSLMHLLLQIPALLRLPLRRYTFTLGLNSAPVREVARLMGPRLIGVAVVQLNFLLNTYLASLISEGSLAGISWAFPLMIMPEAAIAQSVAIAALPTFSAQVARGRLDDMRSSLAAVLRLVLLLALPATLGLIVLRVPVVALIYQRGSFTAESTQLVAWALLWYAAGLVGHSLVEVISRAFYALHDTRTPVTIGVAAMTLNLLLSLAFTALFRQIGWMPHGGLALANSFATALEAAVLLVLIRKRLSGLEGASILRLLGQSALACAVMGAVLYAWLWFAGGLPNTVLTLGGAALGMGTYFAAALLLGVKDLRLLVVRLKERLLRRA